MHSQALQDRPRRALVGPVLVGTLAVVSCTAANPQFDTPCAVGSRICVESTARPSYPVVCGLNDSGALALIDERCPGGGCADGRCVAPQGARACTRQRDCDSGQVCVPVVAGAALTRVCVSAAQAPSAPGAACAKDADCQSRLCLPYRGGGICLMLCQGVQDCTIPAECGAVSVTITGVSGTVQSCGPG